MRKSTILIIILLIIAVVATGCKKEQKTIVVASKPMTEQYIIAEMLTMLIEAKSDITVKQSLGIGGGTSNIHPALVKGEVDLYPEYTGTGWLMVLKRDPIAEPLPLYEAVKKAYSDELSLAWTGLYGFANNYVIAVRGEVAREYGLAKVSDLAAYSNTLIFAANPDFLEREDGYPGLVETYGLSFKSIKEIDIGLRFEAISSAAADVIPIYTTDSRLKIEDVVLLEDDRHYFTSYLAATIVREQTLKTYPELTSILELLTGAINDQEMVAMNYQVEIEKQDPKDVARAFLASKGLL
ncbi:MAG: glycine betaine ABC transporter substrate-binding protein [Sphaerochaeta sp.]|nr:glycine/betaine ABC transporter substrate-binding protein [Spirochaetales bacterium]